MHRLETLSVTTATIIPAWLLLPWQSLSSFLHALPLSPGPREFREFRSFWSPRVFRSSSALLSCPQMRAWQTSFRRWMLPLPSLTNSEDAGGTQSALPSPKPVSPVRDKTSMR